MQIAGYEICDRITEFPMDKIKQNFISNGKRGRGKRNYYTKIVTLDTETCIYKGNGYITDISLTFEGIATYYCRTISELFVFLDIVQKKLSDGLENRMIIYVHNLSYDYVFLRNALIEHYGFPVNSLAVKTHKYVSMDFGFFEFRDSLILTQKSLDKLTRDENVKVKKAVGYWDYNKIRSPHSVRSNNEMYYVNVDTISLCMALRSVFRSRKCCTADVPLTSTGFIRNECRKRSRVDKKWRHKFKEIELSYEEYLILTEVFHGGYTHANRYYIGVLCNDLHSFDFASSYPAVMLYEKFPMEKFKKCDEITVEDIIDMSDDFAFFGYITIANLKLDKDSPMPPIALSKCKTVKREKLVVDNGRITECKYLKIPFSDPDLPAIIENYSFSYIAVSECRYARKDYLPKWFRDYIQELYYNKCALKGVDPINYMISKGMLNSLYGMCAQKILREEIQENFENCEWSKNMQGQEEFEKFYNKSSSFLPYQWAIWVTAYAQRNLFLLGKNCGTWIYSDTDSCKGTNWNLKGVEKYNKNVELKAEKLGYGIVEYKGKRFVIGQAENETEDSIITEFKTLGCKRYCYRQDGELHLTVAGVPKIAVAELKNDINNFGKNFTFHSVVNDIDNYVGSNKLRPEYYIKNDANYINVLGEEIRIGSFIILQPTDYILDQTIRFDEETGLPFNYDFDDVSSL